MPGAPSGCVSPHPSERILNSTELNLIKLKLKTMNLPYIDGAGRRIRSVRLRRRGRPARPGPGGLRHTFVAGDVLLGAQERLYRAESQCTGSVCTVTYEGESVTVDLSDVDPEGDASSVTITGRQVRNGVHTGRLRADGEGDTRFDAFGVWGDWNAATTGAGSTVLQGIDIRFVVPTSVGQGSGSNPCPVG